MTISSARSGPVSGSATTQAPGALAHYGRVVYRTIPDSRIPDSSWESWLDFAQYRIKEAFALPLDWDMEGAEQVTHQAAEWASQLAEDLNEWRVLRPSVGATQAGGIGFEWSGTRIELHIEVIDAGLLVMVRDPESGEFWEGTPDEVGERLDAALSSLMR